MLQRHGCSSSPPGRSYSRGCRREARGAGQGAAARDGLSLSAKISKPRTASPRRPGAAAPHSHTTSREAAPSAGRAGNRENFSAYGERSDRGGNWGGKCRKPEQHGRQELAGGAGKSCCALSAAAGRGWQGGSGGARPRPRLASSLTSVLSAAFSAIFLLRSRQREECFIPIRASQGVGASGLLVLVLCFQRSPNTGVRQRTGR